MEYFTKAKNYKALIEAYTNTNDFDNLKDLIQKIPEGSKELVFLGEQLQANGVCEKAVESYLRANEVKRAIDCCVLLNQWNLAVELAEKHNYQQIENLLSQYARHLLDKRKKLEAVELYRKANRNTDAALLLQEIAEDLIKKEVSITPASVYVSLGRPLDHQETLRHGCNRSRSVQEPYAHCTNHWSSHAELESNCGKLLP